LTLYGLRFLFQTKNVPLNAWITVLFEILPASIQKKYFQKIQARCPPIWLFLSIIVAPSTGRETEGRAGENGKRAQTAGGNALREEKVW